MKKLFITLSVSLLVMVGCAKPQENTQPAPTAEATPTATPEEKKEEAVKVEFPTLASNSYAETMAGRGHITVSDVDSQTKHFLIEWAESASVQDKWEMDVTYDPKNERLLYNNCTKTITEFDASGNGDETVEYTDGTGYFSIVGENLQWHDDMLKEAAEEPAFAPIPESGTGLANPWTETEDPTEAEKVSGLTFDLMPEYALGENMKLWKYVCMEGVYGAKYESVNNEMIIRKSKTIPSEELHGDYNTYSKSWDITLKGVTVHCLGDGETANVAMIDAGDRHYSISMNPGQEGHGLTPDEINTILNGMQ